MLWFELVMDRPLAKRVTKILFDEGIQFQAKPMFSGNWIIGVPREEAFSNRLVALYSKGGKK